MPKSFKCPICGCTEHYQIGTVDHDRTETSPFVGTGTPGIEKRIEPRALIKYDFSTSGDTNANLEFGSNFEAYLCKKCGHVELFAEGMLKEIQKSEESLKNQIADKKVEIQELENKLRKAEEEKDKVEKRLEELARLLKSEDITIKEHKQYAEEKDSAELEVKKLIKEFTYAKEQYNHEIELLEELKEKYKCVGSVKSINKRNV